MIHPGHPLMLAVSDIVLEQHSNLLRQGAILVDPADEGDEASLLFLSPTRSSPATAPSSPSDSSSSTSLLPAKPPLQDGHRTSIYEPLATADRALLADLLAVRLDSRRSGAKRPRPRRHHARPRALTAKSPDAASPMWTRLSPPFTSG